MLIIEMYIVLNLLNSSSSAVISDIVIILKRC